MCGLVIRRKVEQNFTIGTISYLEVTNYWYDIVPFASENVRNKKTKRRSPSPRVQAEPVSSSTRDRVLNAAFSLFREHGFSSTSMLVIVTQPRIPNRDLHPLFKTNHAPLTTTTTAPTTHI